MPEPVYFYGPPQEHWTTPLKEGLKNHWVDIALVVSAVGLVTIALLSHLGVVHFPLSTVSPKFIEYALYSGAGAAGFALFNLWISRLCQSVKEDESSDLSEVFSEESGDEFDPSLWQNELSTDAEEWYTEESIIEQEERPSTVNLPHVDYKSWDSQRATAHPSQRSFQLSGQPATLYGVYEKKTTEIQRFENEIIELLQQGNRPSDWQQQLNTLLKDSKHSFILRVGNNLIVASNKYMVMNHQACELSEITRVFNIEKNTGSFFIFGSRDTLERIKLDDVTGAPKDVASMGDALHRHVNKKERFPNSALIVLSI
jgi:hypothetical protein